MSETPWTMDDLGKAVRSLVRVVMGMPENSVRPADQRAPAGDQTTEIATVKILTADEVGRSARTIEADPDDDELSIEALEVPVRFVASIQFFRRPAVNADATTGKDPTGAARYGTAAFDRAVQLGQRLQLSSSVEAMARMGLCLSDVGGARNLAAIVDANWESRGQVDVTFNVISRITAPIQTITTVPLTTQVQDPGDDVHTTTTEVST